jgi:hypothetical protein
MPARRVDFLQLLGCGDVAFSPQELFFPRAAEFARFAQQARARKRRGESSIPVKKAKSQ